MFDLSTYWLRINYYLLSHREDLKKWWVILLIAVDIFMVVFVFTNLILYLIRIDQSAKSMIAMALSPIDYQSIRVESAPLALENIASIAIPQPNQSYDLIGMVRNNNKNWAIQEIEYSFSLNGQETELKTETVMPNSEKYLTALGVRDTGGGGTSPEISQSLGKIRWQRVDKPDEIAAITFGVDNLEYLNLSSTEGVGGHRVEADITNNSFNSYWQARFIVVLYSGEELAGVEHVYFDRFESGETKSLFAQWEVVPLKVSSVAIFPDFNYLDEENIIK